MTSAGPARLINPDDKTFVLGLGHQKCGTTWLYTYLAQNAHFAGGVAKEYHVWDAADLPELNHLRIGALQARLAPRSERGKLALIRSMQRRPGVYFDYFAGLLRGGKTLSGDITPSYSGLGTDRLTQIRNGFAERGLAVKVVILIREPLSRIKSAVRFNLDRGNYNEGITRGETDFARALGQYYASPYCEVRTRYDKTIERARSVFGNEAVYVGCFENMFDAAEIGRVSAFLGVASDPSFAHKKVNSTKGTAETTPIEAQIIEHYGEVYDYCFANVPAARDLWMASGGDKTAR